MRTNDLWRMYTMYSFFSFLFVIERIDKLKRAHALLWDVTKLSFYRAVDQTVWIALILETWTESGSIDTDEPQVTELLLLPKPY